MRRLSPLQRAYLLGFRRGVRWAWNRMCGKADQWETEIASLQAEYQALVSENAP
jgi:hypothetical protein